MNLKRSLRHLAGTMIKNGTLLCLLVCEAELTQNSVVYISVAARTALSSKASEIPPRGMALDRFTIGCAYTVQCSNKKSRPETIEIQNARADNGHSQLRSE